jgi:hypothetical protein
MLHCAMHWFSRKVLSSHALGWEPYVRAYRRAQAHRMRSGMLLSASSCNCSHRAALGCEPVSSSSGNTSSSLKLRTSLAKTFHAQTYSHTVLLSLMKVFEDLWLWFPMSVLDESLPHANCGCTI